VLGELHIGMNTLVMPGVPPALGLFDALIEQRDAEIGHAGIARVWTRARTRMDYYSPSPGDHDLERGAERSRWPPTQVIAIADLVLRRGRHLRVETRERHLSWGHHRS
jgi:hypothetical protein